MNADGIASLLDLVSDLGWMDDAACVGGDPELFFPEKGDPVSSGLAKKVFCSQCTVRADCLEYGQDLPGVWGGFTEAERLTLQRDAA